MMPEIRLATKDDLDAVWEMFRGAVRRMREDGIDQWDEIYPDLDTLREDVEKREMLLLTESGEPVAAAVVNEDQPKEYEEVPWTVCEKTPAAVIHRLCVSALARGRGLGRKTLFAAEQTARERGYRYIRLDTFTKNMPAKKLYESGGYRIAGSVTFRKGQFYCFEKLLTEKPGHMKLENVGGSFSVCRIADVKDAAVRGTFLSLTKTEDEISLVCPTEDVPKNCIAREDGWACIRIAGTLDFSLVGVLARISKILAESGVSIFAVSTFNTDYVLLKQDRLSGAAEALRKHGYELG